jgi:hypothetical protein
MSTATRRDVFVTSTPASFRRNVSREHILHATNTLGPRGTVDGGHHGSLDQRGNGISASSCSESADLRTVKRVLDVLKGGDMDVVGFLDALCWGNQKAIADPSTKAARTNLTHSDRLATIVSRWLRPPRTSQGGSTAGGARRVLLPLVIETVQEIINEEMDAVVEELKEESDVTEENVLGMMIGDIQEVVRVIAPVFYSLVRTAAWSKKQEEQNTLRDPAKVRMYYWLGSQRLTRRTFSVSRLSSARRRFREITLQTRYTARFHCT